jgi:hypothetical protein
VEKIGKLNYRLRLPDDWDIHDVFHVVLLTKAERDQIPGRVQIPPPNPPVLPPRVYEEEFEIEKIVDSRVNRKGVFEYLVKWKDYAAKHNSWEPASNLDLNDNVFETFHVENPAAPRHLAAATFGDIPFYSLPSENSEEKCVLFDWTYGKHAETKKV